MTLFMALLPLNLDPSDNV